MEMDEKTMRLQDKIDYILKPLGYYVKFSYKHWHVYDKFGLGAYGYESSTSEGQYLAELDLNGLLSQISQTKMFDLIEKPIFWLQKPRRDAHKERLDSLSIYTWKTA